MKQRRGQSKCFKCGETGHLRENVQNGKESVGNLMTFDEE
jgi:hypothetical protein